MRGRTTSSSSQSNDGSITTRLRDRRRRVGRRRSPGRRRRRRRHVRQRVRGMPVDSAVDRLRIRVDQQLRRVEALAGLGLVRPVHAVAVALPGPDARQVAVPVERGALVQLDPLLAPVARRRGRARRARRSPRRARSSCPRRPTPGRAGTAARARRAAHVAAPRSSRRSRRRACASPRRIVSTLPSRRDVELARQRASQLQQLAVERIRLADAR